MGIIISLILIAFGAILTWGVNATSSSIDVDVVGVILMVVGIVVFLISLVLWRTWWGAGFWRPWYDDPAAPAVAAACLPTGQAAKHHLRGGRRAASTTTTRSIGRHSSERG